MDQLWFAFIARLIMDKRTGRTKGFGFVTFETEVEAQNAIKALNGKVCFSPGLAILSGCLVVYLFVTCIL